MLPYYGYARQDRKDVGRVPITAKLVADLLTSAAPLAFWPSICTLLSFRGFLTSPSITSMRGRSLTNMSMGYRSRCAFRRAESGRSASRSRSYIRRNSAARLPSLTNGAGATETKQVNLIGASLENKVVVIFDDMISTAGSIVGAANIAKKNGAREIYACATHGVLCG